MGIGWVSLWRTCGKTSVRPGTKWLYVTRFTNPNVLVYRITPPAD